MLKQTRETTCLKTRETGEQVETLEYKELKVRSLEFSRFEQTEEESGKKNKDYPNQGTKEMQNKENGYIKTPKN